MWRARRIGAGAAAVLPAALAGAVLVSAPFAGTTTAPLAETDQAAVHLNLAPQFGQQPLGVSESPRQVRQGASCASFSRARTC